MASTINASNGLASGLISTGDASGILQLQVNNGTAALTLNTSGAVGVGSSPSYGTSGQVLVSGGSSAAPSWTSYTPSSLSANAVVTSLLETATVTAAAPSSTTNFDVKTQAVQYYTSNTANNWTLNIRGDGSTTLNSVMSTGQAITIAFLATNSSTAYYNSAVTIDGTSVTPKWQTGTAPSSGNASAIDVYTYTIIKTASATYTVLASQVKFA